MARTIIDISNEVYAKLEADTTIPSSISQSAVYRRFVFIVCYAIWLLESLFDTHYKEVKEAILNDKPHTQSWYRTKSLAFQYGFSLIEDTDKFDNAGYTDEQINDSKIIKYSAVTKSGGRILIKIATETAGILVPIAPEVKNSFDAYIEEIADCGVKYIVVNHLPDILKLWIKIYRNPLVLTNTGMSILNGNYPVQDAINEYMKKLPFNGELVLAHLVDTLQQVEGVDIPHIYNATSEAININTGDTYLPPEFIDVKTVPVAGYFTIPNFDNITYVV